MNTEPIICSGNELSGVLADLRSRGMCVQSLQTGVGSSAGYRVSYFERGNPTGRGGVEVVKQTSHDLGGAEMSPPATAALTNLAGDKNGEGLAVANDQPEREIKHSRKLDSLPSNFKTFPTSPIDASSGTSQSGRDSTRPVKGAQVAGHDAQEERPGADKSRMGAHPKAHAGAKLNEQANAGGRIQQTSAAAGGESRAEKPKSALDAPASISYGGKTISLKTPRDAEDSRQTNEGEAQRTHPQDCTAVILSIEDRMSALQERLTVRGQLRRSKPREVRLPYTD